MECDIAKILGAAWTFLKDLVPLAAVVIAGLGLRTWRDQLSGTTRHSAAVKAMRESLAMRSAIRRARGIRGYSIPEDKADWGEEMLQNLYTQHRNQIAPLFTAWAALEAAELDAAVFFGEVEVAAAIQDLYGCAGKFSAAFEQFYQEEIRRIRRGEKARTPEAVDFARVLRGDEKDGFGKELESSFLKARAFFEPHVR